MCENCKKYVRQLRALAAAIRKTSEDVSASDVERAKSHILQQFPKK
jgi:hypothetical protein